MYPKTILETDDLELKQWTCFILMPFGDPYDEIYHEVIKEVLEENNYSVSRADELYGSKPIMGDILKGITSSELIIADLTDKNPNVFYELGIAHTIKDNDNVILLSQTIEDVPFDIRPYRVMLYNPTISGAKALKKQLSKTLKEYRTNPIEIKDYKFIPSSPIWYKNDEDTLKGEITEPNQFPMIFNKKGYQSDSFTIKLKALSTGPEINIMFYTDGKVRYSGYHLWFWKGGLKLRRLEEELFLEKGYSMKPGYLHQIEISYDKGIIVIIIDNEVRKSYEDQNPLHSIKKLKYMGFNIWSGSKGFVEFSDIEIK